MDFTLLFLNALLFGVLLSVLLSIVMLVSFAIAADMWIGDYPPDIQERYGEMSGRAKRFRPLIAILFFGAILICTALSIARLRALSAVEVGFLGFTHSMFISIMYADVAHTRHELQDTAYVFPFFVGNSYRLICDNCHK